MKLELKNLAPYLPYGIKFQTPYGILELTNISVLDRYKVWFEANNSKDINYKILRENHCIGKGFYLKTVKPILRPMSDFDNPNKHNGDFYSFMSELNSELPYDYQIDRDLDFNIEHPRYVACKYALEVYDFLFKNHFDVFGLIDAGLAIDINTLPELLNG